MAGVGAVGHSRTGGAGALIMHGLAGCVDTVRIKCESQVVVGAGKDCMTAIYHCLGGRDNLLHDYIDGLDSTLCQFLAGLNKMLEFIKNGHFYPSSVSCWSWVAKSLIVRTFARMFNGTEISK